MSISPSGQHALAERADIHKSCKAIETLVNVLNDYCEAAGAVVTLQKKLAKALRDTAGMKVTGAAAANAMNTSASIFDTLSDVDSKFAKIADKEYDSISSQVKKWFKKLAKEEKAHDERVSNANARIRQAGQAYEKKSKKKSVDISEEHTRYINILSTLGPEISQDKYNHSLSVNQKHATTTYNVASCLCRIADAEWLRTCEGVRRFSPTIGQLNEWRVLCEGGWMGPIPPDLPDIDASKSSHGPMYVNDNEVGPARPAMRNMRSMESREIRDITQFGVRLPTRHMPSEGDSSRREYNIATNVQKQNQSFSSSSGSSDHGPLLSPPRSFEPPRPLVDPNTGSVRSLSAFPAPPTHLPMPPRRLLSSLSASSSNANLPTASPTTESPTIANQSLNPTATSRNSPNPSPAHPPSVPSPKSLTRHLRERPLTDSEERGVASPVGERSSSTERTLKLENANDYSKINSIDDVHDPGTERDNGVLQTLRAESNKSSGLERTDTTNSKGSIVAAMRNRLLNNPGSATSSPKEVPRLTTRVPDLATRYEAGDSSSRPRIISPAQRKLSLPLLETSPRPIDGLRVMNDRSLANSPIAINSDPVDAVYNSEDNTARHRRQNFGEIVQLGLKEKERELRNREHEIALRARELELERARLIDLRGLTADERSGRNLVNPQTANANEVPRAGITPHTHHNQGQPTRERRPSLRQQLRRASRISMAVITSNDRTEQKQGHLNSPTAQQQQFPRSSSREEDTKPDHAPYCGCATCSVAKYRLPPAPATASIQTTPAPEKPRGGWMRRLSMPVGHAFQFESKRSTSGGSTGNGVIHIGNGIAGGKGVYVDGRKNVSATALYPNEGAQEDGRIGSGIGARLGRRSYEAANRSMTNLGIAVRR